MSKAKSITSDELDAAWRALAGPEPDAPPHALSVTEYAAKYGVPCTTAFTQLARAVQTGKLATGYKRLADAHGRSKIVKAYWPKEVASDGKSSPKVLRGGKRARTV